MIQLNPIYKFDREGLADYLHNEALKGNHIVYVSTEFLIFKKGVPREQYFTVLFWDDVPKEKIKMGKVFSSFDYKIFKSDKETQIEIKKKSWISRFLGQLAIIPMMLLFMFTNYSGSLNNHFILANSRNLFALIIFPIVILDSIIRYLYFKKKERIRFKQNPLFKGKWDHLFNFFRSFIFVLCIIIVFGINMKTLLFIMLYAFYYYSYGQIPIIVGIIMFIILFAQINYYNQYKGPALDYYFSFKPEIHFYTKSRTLFVSDYENAVIWEHYFIEENAYLSYEYYHVTSNWVFKQLEHHLSDDIVLSTYQSLNAPSFEQAYIKVREDQSELYYFKSGYQVLIIYNDSSSTTEQIIEFAKMKLNIRE